MKNLNCDNCLYNNVSECPHYGNRTKDYSNECYEFIVDWKEAYQAGSNIHQQSQNNTMIINTIVDTFVDTFINLYETTDHTTLDILMQTAELVKNNT